MPRFDLAVGGADLSRALSDVLLGRADRAGVVAAFEEQFASWLGARHAIFLPSARTGLFLVLEAARRLGRIPADRPGVIVPSWTHASVPMVIQAAGHAPRFVDSDPATQNAEAATCEPAWQDSSAAVVTHLYGCPADAEAWVASARRHGGFVIEDCAQALGARLRGHRCGTFGDAAYFSFSLTKNFTTLGGGMVTTSDDSLAAGIREQVSERAGAGAGTLLKPLVMGLGFAVATRPWMFGLTIRPALRMGWTLTGRDLLHERFDEPIRFSAPSGPVGRPLGVQASLGLRQLPALDAENARRTEIGRRLKAGLEGLPIGLPAWRDDSEPIFMSFVVRANDRMRFMRALLERGVDTSPGYLRACHRLPPWGPSAPSTGSPAGTFAGAEELEARQVHLPVYPRLSPREVDHVIASVRAACEKLYGASRPSQEVPA